MQPERPPRGNNSLSWTSYSSAYFLARAKMTKHNSSRWRLWAIEKKEKVVAEKKRVLWDQSTLVQLIPLPPFLFGTSIFEVYACFSGLKCF
jgi:hypothetical protein